MKFWSRFRYARTGSLFLSGGRGRTVCGRRLEVCGLRSVGQDVEQFELYNPDRSPLAKSKCEPGPHAGGDTLRGSMHPDCQRAGAIVGDTHNNLEISSRVASIWEFLASWREFRGFWSDSWSSVFPSVAQSSPFCRRAPFRSKIAADGERFAARGE
jgi:hypothetical protein